MYLTFDRPARNWEETIPIGNGFLGGMIHGGVTKDIIGLNDHEFWSNPFKDSVTRDHPEIIEQIRKLVFDNKRLQAEKLIEEKFLGRFTSSFLPLGNIEIEQLKSIEVKEYLRYLDIDQSIVKVSYVSDNVKIDREYFASYPDKSIYMKLNSSEKNKKTIIKFDTEWEINYESFSTSAIKYEIQAPEIVLPNYLDSDNPIIKGDKGITYSYLLNVLDTDGTVSVKNEAIEIENSTFIELAFTRSNDITKSYVVAKERHYRDYKRLYKKLYIEMSGTEDMTPIKKRLAELADGKIDYSLFALYFQYNRYLLISSSREGSLPPNLQGLWNWSHRPPWSSNYTTNINLQMNYWPAYQSGLEECYEPYVQFIKELVKYGKSTAKKYYGCRGSVIHHNTDRWYLTNPVGRRYDKKAGEKKATTWAMWPMAGVWLVNDLFRHYQYTVDVDFLNNIFSTFKEITIFLVDFLYKYNGEYHLVPSTSPENVFYDEGDAIVAIDYSTTMDITLIREHFIYFKEICEILNLKDELLVEVDRIYEQLPKCPISTDGRIQEWQNDYKEVEPGHRHFSHLYGAYPGDLFTDEYLRATEKSLERRIAYGSGHTGWSNAWLINLYSILGKRKQAFVLLREGLINATLPNLWSTHPPFQIDGNFGNLAGMINLLAYERNGKVFVIPKMPATVGKGAIKGIRLRNRKVIDLIWNDEGDVRYKIRNEF